MEKFEKNTAKVWYITATHLLGSFPWADAIECFKNTSKCRPSVLT